jgi:hypothetical protein
MKVITVFTNQFLDSKKITDVINYIFVVNTILKLQIIIFF